MISGFITLHRKILDWEWYEDANVMRVFLHLLLTANHKDKKWKGTTIKRGQLATSYDSIAVKLRLTKKQVRLAVSKLKGSGELTSRRAPSYILLSLVKYDDYQSNRVEEGTQRALNNNDNNDNNVNNDNNIRSTDIKVLKDAYLKK